MDAKKVLKTIDWAMGWIVEEDWEGYCKHCIDYRINAKGDMCPICSLRAEAEHEAQKPNDDRKMIDLFKVLPRRMRDTADLIDRRGNRDLANGYRDAAGMVQRALDGEED